MQKTSGQGFHCRMALLLAALLLGQPACADWRWSEVDEVVALSDVHGAHDGFRRALAASGVIDAEGGWAAGDRHLVITGDLLDRGADSRAVMDLLMRLEGEAAAAGGRVTLLLGNHEVMNLVGDLRYVAPGEYAAFAAEETPEERAAWRERFLARATATTPAAELAAQFERAHPPGFFAHRRAFRADGQYGAWLLGKPFVVVVNDTAFAHGGLSPAFAALGLERLNETLGSEVEAYVRALATLVDAGLLLPGDGFYAHAKLLAALPPAEYPPEVEAAIATISSSPMPSVHDNGSPTWYRGHVGCPAILERSRLDAALAAVKAGRIVIGHTPTANREVVGRIDERIIEIDTGMLTSYYGGSAHALRLPAGGVPSVIGEDGTLVLGGVLPDPRPEGRGSLSAEAITALLRDGTLSAGERREDGGVAVTVMDGEQGLPAVFYEAPSKRSLPAVAAFRLDRLLGIGLVPITVRRALDGRDGALQVLPEKAISEGERAQAQAGGGAWCPLPDQWQSMYLFDALVFQDGRSPGQILYDREAFQLFLVGNNDAFGTKSSRPRYLSEVELDVTPAWRAALGTLTPELVEREFGDVLDGRQRRALLKRRDRLLEGS